MRFGISATSLMCPKNLRTRLRPVNVCCAIVASRYRRPSGASPSKVRLRPPFGVVSIHFEGWKVTFRAKGPEFVLPAVKTQNDARGATFVAPARQNHFVTDCK